MAPFPLVSIAGDVALFLTGEQSLSQTVIGIAMGIIPGGKILSQFGKWFGGLSHGFAKTMTHYATKFFGAVKRWAGEVAGKFSATAARWLGKACGCFDADTPVWTTTGPVAIQDINVGDDVLATDETTGELSLRKVLRKYVRAAAPIVVVTMVSVANGAETSLRTTEDHPFYVVAEAAKADQHDEASESTTIAAHTRSQAGWTRVGVLRPGSLVDTLEGVARVVRLQFTDELKPVYNFEVEGVHTYRVGSDGVLVHNSSCPIGRIFPYNEAQRLTQGLAGDIQAHHLVEVRHFAPKGRIPGDPTRAPAVVLTREEHQQITNQLRQRLPYGQRYEPEDIRAAYEEIYAPYPDWLDAVRTYFR